MIEITVALGIFVIIIISWYSFIIKSYQLSEFALQQQEAVRQAQAGIEIMTQEIREMSTAEDGSYSLALADDNEIIFYSDINNDYLTERIRYYLANNKLYKGVIQPTGDPLSYPLDHEVVQTIASFTNNGPTNLFTYYNEAYPFDTDNNPLPAPARLIETKLIHLDLIININPHRDPENFLIESDIQLRNLKTNL